MGINNNQVRPASPGSRQARFFKPAEFAHVSAELTRGGPNRRQTYPGRGGLVTKETKGRRRRSVPIIEPLRDTLTRLTEGAAGRSAVVTRTARRCDLDSHVA